MNWRKLNKILHRDIGYLAVGLTIVYAISGIAVNHVSDWNPNYVIENDTIKIEVLLDSNKTTESMTDFVIDQIKLEDKPESVYRAGPDVVELFYRGKTISANVATGITKIETVSNRSIFREANYLHLNAPKKIWTYVADLFAGALILLAVTGLFIIKGKNGITGRGKWLTLVGFMIPIIFLIIYF